MPKYITTPVDDDTYAALAAAAVQTKASIASITGKVVAAYAKQLVTKGVVDLAQAERYEPKRGRPPVAADPIRAELEALNARLTEISNKVKAALTARNIAFDFVEKNFNADRTQLDQAQAALTEAMQARDELKAELTPRIEELTRQLVQRKMDKAKSPVKVPINQ